MGLIASAFVLALEQFKFSGCEAETCWHFEGIPPILEVIVRQVSNLDSVINETKKI